MSFINLVGELVAIEVEQGRTEGQVLLPDWKRSLSGIVIGKGREAKEVSLGDRVYFGAAVGMDSVYAGRDVRILKQEDIDIVDEA